jgi:hypothetical protein
MRDAEQNLIRSCRIRAGMKIRRLAKSRAPHFAMLCSDLARRSKELTGTLADVPRSMSRSALRFGAENLLRGFSYPSCRHHKIDSGNDDLALRDEYSRTIAAIPDPDIASSRRFRNRNGDVEHRNAKSIECLHDRPPEQIDPLSRHNLRMSYRNLFLPVVMQSQLRKQRKINDWNMTRRSALRRAPCFHGSAGFATD